MLYTEMFFGLQRYKKPIRKKCLSEKESLKELKIFADKKLKELNKDKNNSSTFHLGEFKRVQRTHFYLYCYKIRSYCKNPLYNPKKGYWTNGSIIMRFFEIED